MNDELDTLRTFRPEAAGPTDDLTLEGRNALMTAIDAEPLPRPTPRRRLLGRRRIRVALVFAAALVAVGSVAAAAGLIPDDVRESLGLASSFEPALAPIFKSGMLIPDNGRCKNPHQLVQLIAAEAQRNGATVIRGEVTGFETNGENVTGIGGDGATPVGRTLVRAGLSRAAGRSQ